MVMKILETYPSTAGTLDYNEKKVAEKKAAIIGVKNIPGDDMLSIRSVFERLERRNIRTANVSFQMAISPNANDPSEKYSDAEAMRMAEKVMKRLGYGDQPFVVVRHNDIEREHYHVISIRVNEQGRKIKDYHEEMDLQKIMKELKKEFHFEIGDGQKKEKEMKRSPDLTKRPERFVPEKGSVREQFKKTFDACMSYKFSTTAQFAALMTDCGFRVEIHHIQGKDYVAFQGLDKQGKPVTEMVDDKDLCLAYTKRLAEHMEQCKDYVKNAKPERFRIKNNALYCAKIAKNENHFRALMAKKGVGVHFAKTDEGKIFGVTFVDHTSRMVFKASEIDRQITAKLFQELKDTGKWKEPEGDSLKMDRFLVPTNTLGIGVFASQHEAEDKLDAADLGTVSEPEQGHEHSTLGTLLASMAQGGHKGGKSKGKDPKQKKKKKRKASYL